jgi:hypothetical protein
MVVCLMRLWAQVMKFAKDSRNECSINVVQVKGATRAVTGAYSTEHTFPTQMQ